MDKRKSKENENLSKPQKFGHKISGVNEVYIGLCFFSFSQAHYSKISPKIMTECIAREIAVDRNW